VEAANQEGRTKEEGASAASLRSTGGKKKGGDERMLGGKGRQAAGRELKVLKKWERSGWRGGQKEGVGGHCGEIGGERED